MVQALAPPQPLQAGEGDGVGGGHEDGLRGGAARAGGPLRVARDGTKNLIRAMERHGVKRLVCESSLGVGDSRGQLGWVFNLLLIPLFLRNVFRDKEVQERYVKQSNLDWVIVRPAALTSGPRTGVSRSGFSTTDRAIRGKIARADVAGFMLKQLTDDTYLRKTPGLSY